mmetsp:Transcript_4235/g.9229  ORF Transcript_4235/g.9229 Transcript_4235/m.9229 type:complete len:83 (+) Transcript_4235:348-596(+)
MFYPYLGFPYFVLGLLVLFLVPRVVRDLGYRLFARNRGKIWKVFKKVTGLGDTTMHPYRDCVVGLVDEKVLPESWGFSEPPF